MLSKRLGIPVEMYDERLTTRAAERVLEADLSRSRRRKVIDKMAAVLSCRVISMPWPLRIKMKITLISCDRNSFLDMVEKFNIK